MNIFAGLLLGKVSRAIINEKLIASFAAKKLQIINIKVGGIRIIALKAIPLSAYSVYKNEEKLP